MSIQIALQYAEELDQTTRNELEQLVIALQNQLPNASLFTTGTLDPDVLPPGTIGGPPTAHHVTHEPGGSDAMTVNAVPTVGSLRTLGTGPNEAAPGNDARFATPAPHHVTHEPGGADALVNAAWTNVANTFTANPQRMSCVSPQLQLFDTAQPVDAREFDFLNAAQTLYIRATNDANTVVQAVPLVMTRLGDATVGRNLTATGSGGNVACKNQQNVFTEDQHIQKALPFLRLSDTSAPADARRFRVYAATQQLTVDASTDAEGSATNILTLNRSGDLAVWRDIHEKARTTALGHWIDVPFSAGNYIIGGGSGTFACNSILSQRYMLVGKTITYAFYCQFTVTGTPTYLRIALPPGIVSATYCGNLFCAGTFGALLQVLPGDSYINLYRIPTSTPWAAQTDYWAGQISFEIQ